MRQRRAKVARRARKREELPVAPLIVYLHRSISATLSEWGVAGDDVMAGRLGIKEALCGRAGIPVRTLYRWERDSAWVALGLLDRVLLNLGALWWDVYDPALAPWLYPPLRWMDIVDEVARAFEGEGFFGND